MAEIIEGSGATGTGAQEGGTPERADLLHRAAEIIWSAMWHRSAEDGPDDPSACTWEEALEREEEMGALVPETIRAARAVHELYTGAPVVCPVCDGVLYARGKLSACGQCQRLWRLATLQPEVRHG